MKFLQVCNVGNICGGTAACAWTITHALAEHEHAVLFLSKPTEETVAALTHCELLSDSKLTDRLLKRQAPDFIILHNTAPNRVEVDSEIPTLLYQHSAGQRAKATHRVACSHWLSQQIPEQPDVLYQPIPIPPKPATSVSRSFSEELIVGRICTPTPKKWPSALLEFYKELAQEFPTIRWEFVGAPKSIQDSLANACGGQVVFHPASASARELLWNWHVLLYHHPILTESFGRTVAEAMRAGCVPIVDAQGGFLEQIEHSRTGYLCYDLGDFKSSLKAIQNPATRLQLSLDAKVSAREKFSLETFYGQFRNLVLEAVSKPFE